MIARVRTATGEVVVNGPTLTADDAGRQFFDAGVDDILMLKRCTACGKWAGPAAEACPHCHQGDLKWEAASGAAELVTWTVLHSPPHPAFSDDMPIVSGLVETAEGPWLNLRLAIPIVELEVGRLVAVVFARPDQGAVYPVAVAATRKKEN